MLIQMPSYFLIRNIYLYILRVEGARFLEYELGGVGKLGKKVVVESLIDILKFAMGGISWMGPGSIRSGV